MSYESFLQKKRHISSNDGFVPVFMPDFLFDFQKSLVEFSVLGGRRAIFADCGMGKTPMQLVWAENIVRKTNGKVLILTPLSVASQTAEEGQKFGIEVYKSVDGIIPSTKKIIVCNYEKLKHFNPCDFVGVVCDESSIIKNFDGSRKGQITDFMKKIKYRLLCTATAAPNDYVELGTSSEALGHLGYIDMLSMFFKNDEESLHPAFFRSKWRFKRYAEIDFWRWMTSWAKACRKPSDLGFKDNKFILPSLNVQDCIVSSLPLPGRLISVSSKRWDEERKERQISLNSRCEQATKELQKTESGIAWCHLSAESTLLKKMIKGAEEVKGGDSDEKKEEVFRAFKNKEVRVLVTKPKIAAFGMNWQHCSEMVYFPTHSYEQYYQAIRRCWRFGQKKQVNVKLVYSEALTEITNNMKRKESVCNKMFSEFIKTMNNPLYLTSISKHKTKERMPAWVA